MLQMVLCPCECVTRAGLVALLSALQPRAAQRTRANLGGVAVRALINLGSSAPGGREAVLKAGGAERLMMLGWGVPGCSSRASSSGRAPCG